MAARDQRIHARIETDFRCLLLTEGGTKKVQLRDLSHAGALLTSPVAVARVRESVTLEIPLPGGGVPISILADVARVSRSGEDFCYALRFALVEPKQRDELVRFIDTLLARSGGGNREVPRVHRRIEVRSANRAELTGFLSSISMAGLSLDVVQNLVLDEEVTVRLSAPGEEALDVLAVVVHVRRIVDGNPDDETHILAAEDETGKPAPKWRVGLRLKDMDSETTGNLSRMINRIIKEQ